MQWHTAFQRPFFLLLTESHARKKENVNNLILIGLHCTERPFLKLLMHNVFTKKNSDGSRH